MPGKNIIKTGFCVAYDWKLLEYSLPPVYASSDMICLSIDHKNRSWSGNEYDFDKAAFDEMIKRIDTEGKVDVYYDNFFETDLNARQNCNRQRTMISERMGLDGGWYVQVDVDEYFIDFDGFVSHLFNIKKKPGLDDKPLNVQVAQFPLIKKLGSGYLYVEFGIQKPNFGPFASNHPKYESARVNGHFNVYSPFYVIHETWSRGREELEFKLKNWGHSAEELNNESLVDSYIEMWDSIDENNYQFIRDFHFTIPEAWPRLEYCEGKSIPELLDNFKPEYNPNRFVLGITNSRIYGKIKQLMS